jgi:hypothetical protein
VAVGIQDPTGPLRFWNPAGVYPGIPGAGMRIDTYQSVNPLPLEKTLSSFVPSGSERDRKTEWPVRPSRWKADSILPAWRRHPFIKQSFCSE